MERFSRDSAHLKHSNSCPRIPNSKTLAFPTEELESNAKCSSAGVYFIDVRNMHDCYRNLTTCVFLSHVRKVGMKSLTHWYQFFMRCEEMVPTLHGVKFKKCEIYGSTQHIYSQTCLKGSPKGRINIGCLRQVTP